jgi:hypothetical protein
MGQLNFNARIGFAAAPPSTNWIYNVSEPPVAPSLPAPWRAWKYDGTLVYNEQNITELGIFTTQDLAQSACQEDFNAVWNAQQTPTPVLTSLVPTSSNNAVAANVTLYGSDFDDAVIATITLADGVTQVQQNPQGIPTESEFWITIPAGDIPAAGTILIAAENGDGQLSAALPYTIIKGPPVLNSLTPTSSVHGAAATITLTGSNFDSGAIGYVTLADGSTTRNYSPTGTPTATGFAITVPAADIAAAGTIKVVVQNGDQQQSGPLSYTVT